jgi:hypothetical protein
MRRKGKFSGGKRGKTDENREYYEKEGRGVGML